MRGTIKKEDRVKMLLFMVCFFIVCVFFIYNLFGGGENTDKEKQPDETNEQRNDFVQHGQQEGISGQRAAFLLSFLQENTLGKEIPATGQRMLNCGELRDILVFLCKGEEIDYSSIFVKLPERLSSVSEEDELYLDEFLVVYEALCDELRKTGKAGVPQEKELLVMEFETGSNELYDEYSKKYDYSDCEDYSEIFQSMRLAQKRLEDEKPAAFKDYLKQRIQVICAGNRILYIKGKSNEESVIPNVWVLNAKDSSVEFFWRGRRMLGTTLQPLKESFEEVVCDLVVRDGSIVGITLKQDLIQGKVLMIDEECIEVEGYGALPMAEQFRIYKVYGQLAMEQTNRILVGYSITDFVVENGTICAALIKEKLHADCIRVLINTTGYKSYYHETVEITSDEAYMVTQGDAVTNHAAGEVVRFEAKRLSEGQQRIVVNTSDGEGKLKVLGITRSCGSPSYRGKLELNATPEGILLINELSLEEYLYAVIPSEMPTSFGDEALKVQAVCARSYAYNQLLASRYRAYGAHVDDSVNCQVYNNVAENDASILAVKETYGLVSVDENGNIINAYYFSTSCGSTASYAEVWESKKNLTYLEGHLQNKKKEQPDFSVEDRFDAFIRNREAETYDAAFAWYRWEVDIPIEQLNEAFSGVTELARVDKLAVTQRGKSGIVLILEAQGENEKGEKETVQIRYQSAVRSVLAPKKCKVIRMDETEVENMNLLPSAFFVLEEIRKDGELDGVKLIGGGYGHGTGMSQNGVKAQVNEGKDFEEILQYYYSGTELKFLYEK